MLPLLWAAERDRQPQPGMEKHLLTCLTYKFKVWFSPQPISAYKLSMGRPLRGSMSVVSYKNMVDMEIKLCRVQISFRATAMKKTFADNLQNPEHQYLLCFTSLRWEKLKNKIRKSKLKVLKSSQFKILVLCSVGDTSPALYSMVVTLTPKKKVYSSSPFPSVSHIGCQVC